MNAEDGSKADNVHKSETKPVGSANVVATPDEVTDNCWAVDISSSAPDPKDMSGCVRRMKQSALVPSPASRTPPPPPPLLFTRFCMHRPSGIHRCLLVHWIKDATAESLNVSEQHLGE